MNDAQQEEFTNIIRGMIRSENDVTNHRIMWLLVGQGFFANAYVASQQASASESYGFMLSLAGILLTLSAFLMIYKSYLARGYLEFLGEQAKLGKLEEAYLPLVGWPRKRIKCWWKGFWVCPWIGRVRDVMEPLLFLPGLFLFLWLSTLLRQCTQLSLGASLMLAVILTAFIICLCCWAFLGSQGKEEK
jgi:hypothetical protein